MSTVEDLLSKMIHMDSSLTEMVRALEDIKFKNDEITGKVTTAWGLGSDAAKSSADLLIDVNVKLDEMSQWLAGASVTGLTVISMYRKLAGE